VQMFVLQRYHWFRVCWCLVSFVITLINFSFFLNYLLFSVCSSFMVENNSIVSFQTAYDFENPKESESPRFQAILRVTSAPRKRFPSDIKSFSHELNSKGVWPFPFLKPRRLNNLEVF